MAAGPASAADGPAATGSFTRELIGEVRGDIAAVDEQGRARARLARRVLAAAVLVALLTGPIALVVSVTLAGTRAGTEAADVTARLAPEVTRQVIADARAQRVQNCRALLIAANDELGARGLPEVADPGEGANAEQVCATASSAQVLSVLPGDIAARLADQASGGVLVLPQADGTITGPTPVPGGTAPGTTPDGTSGSRPDAPGTSAPSARQSPPPATGPPTTPPPSDIPGLLPRLIPIPVPRLLQPLLSA